jgi:hypothetical protein
MHYMMPMNVISGPTAVSQTAHHAFNPIFRIVGPLLQLVGAAIVATANRRGEPDRKNTVK